MVLTIVLYLFTVSGLTARSLAGLGKQMSKSKKQLQVIAKRTSPIAGATGATTTEAQFLLYYKVLTVTQRFLQKLFTLV